MSKVTITFNLPEEQYEHACAISGMSWKNIVHDMSMFLRNALKYGHKYKNADEAIEAMKTELWELCNAEHLDPLE